MNRRLSEGDKKIAAKLSEAVNTFSIDEEGVAKALATEHRTLQQTFTRVCVEWLKVLASTEYYDARNEASVKLAKSLMQCEGVREVLDTGLPMI